MMLLVQKSGTRIASHRIAHTSRIRHTVPAGMSLTECNHANTPPTTTTTTSKLYIDWLIYSTILMNDT